EHELRGTRSEMRSLGMRLPARDVSEGAFSLTGRELDIARLVAQRLTNKEIAARLDISARTVSTHLSNMFGKLGVDSRVALVDALRAQPGFADGT
ncbi:MAG TPA: helix-turn-helix transcriptional regulator, partial [Gemmatimonadaceae bacterium]|nr:helix-turn-helix transcriptional regulator [Gemmatimonadaceae bacterium]